MDKIFNYLKYNLIQTVLVIFSIYDLRIDIRLLLDYFTLSTLMYTIADHPLAIMVLLTIPMLSNSHKKNNK